MGVAHQEEADSCLGLDEKHRKIRALVMWYLNPLGECIVNTKTPHTGMMKLRIK